MPSTLIRLTRSILVTPLIRGCETGLEEITVPNSVRLKVLRILIGMFFETAGAIV